MRDCKEIVIPPDVLDAVQFRRDDTTTVRGEKAMTVAMELLKRGLVSLPMLSKTVEDRDMQIRGNDLLVTPQYSIQVKCDYWCAEYGLSIQTHEINPLKQH